MERFIHRFGDKVIGILSGFDRLVFRGTIRYLAVESGMMDFLGRHGILLKHFGKFAEECSERLKQACYEVAARNQRPLPYLESSKTNKEQIALEIAKKDGITEGLIAILKCVELCRSFDVHRAKESIELISRERKCLYLYHYFYDSEFGFMSARIQTWLPFTIQICINGREWLSKKLDQAGLDYCRRDNCFTRIEDIQRAQRLMDSQLKINWPRMLNRIAKRINPAQSQIFKGEPMQYYWSVFQSEWATDLMFKDSAALAEIYPRLVLQGIAQLSSADVMRFLGRKVHGAFRGEIISDFKDRPEGIRIKHRLGQNSVKLYDKQGSVLRVETTINKPRDIKVYRPKENDPSGECAWRYLRQGVADLYRRAQFCQASNERYLDTLVAFDLSTPFGDIIKQITKATSYNGKRVRGLRPWFADDLCLLKAVSRGEFLMHGFRNRDLQPFLFEGTPKTDRDRLRRSSKVTRLLRLLRAHHIIRRIASTYRYMLTEKGKQILNAMFTIDKITLEKLQNVA